MTLSTAPIVGVVGCGVTGRRIVARLVAAEIRVAVHDTAGVRVGEGVHHLAQDAHGLGDGHLPLARQALAEGFAVHEGHDVVEEAVGGPRIEQRQEVGVLQLGHGLDFAHEALGAERRSTDSRG